MSEGPTSEGPTSDDGAAGTDEPSTAADEESTVVADGGSTTDSGATRGEPGTASRAFVLGLDGVPWDLLSEWAEAGELPNVARLLEEGAAGPLESTTPATTPLAWPSIATGVGPDKHGIYGWRDLSPEYSHRMYTGNDVSGPFLWDLLEPAVVGNVPMTYPAREIDGSMVAGLMTPELGEGFTHPPELTDEIETAVPDYQIGLYWEDYDGATPAFQTDLQSLVENRRALMDHLVDREDWELFFFVYTAPDRLQHLCWDESVLLDHYRYLDGIVGDAMDYAAERDATLYVVSDHGFGPVDTTVAPNRALADVGLLSGKTDSGSRSTLDDLGITRDRVLDTLERVGIDQKTILDHLPRPVVDAVAERVPGDDVLYDVEFERTKAFAHGPGNIYVNDTERFESGIVPPSDVPEVKEQIIGVLSSITDPQTGELVLEVEDGDELFPADPESPDVAIEGRDGHEVVTSWQDRDVVAPAESMEAGHRMDGIFCAWGPAIEAGATPEDATVYDVAPTLLHDLGEPIPDRVDGRVLSELFDPETDPASATVRTEAVGDASGTEDVSEDMDAVEDRLRGLGYME